MRSVRLEQEVRIKSMLWVLELKLYWDPFRFAATLRDTAELPIVEISREDTFWGRNEAEDSQLRGQRPGEAFDGRPSSAGFCETRGTGLTTLTDIARALNLRGIKTNRGCEFTPTQIHRLLRTA